ncbi:MAG: hypothetical protein Q4B54_05215 [Coriobacteriales bacterium]|nr:hypothetical protein [Coriobacteriales bacterium]
MAILVALLISSITMTQLPVETKTLLRRVGFLLCGGAGCVGTHIRMQGSKKKCLRLGERRQIKSVGSLSTQGPRVTMRSFQVINTVSEVLVMDQEKKGMIIWLCGLVIMVIILCLTFALPNLTSDTKRIMRLAAIAIGGGLAIYGSSMRKKAK